LNTDIAISKPYYNNNLLYLDILWAVITRMVWKRGHTTGEAPMFGALA
jgi:hypothetical protein